MYQDPESFLETATPVKAQSNLSILKNFAKTVFNKCSGLKNAETSLTPMEQAKFDAAKEMVREGKTTRYAYNQYKNKCEQPLLNGYRKVLTNHLGKASATLDLSDKALRKLANFLDQQDQSALENLKENPSRYAVFVNEAYNIATEEGGRSKSRRIAAKLQDVLKSVDTKVSLNSKDLHALIARNIGETLTPKEIATDIEALAQKIQTPLRELSSIIKTMSAEDRAHDGINDRCFWLLDNNIGINFSNNAPKQRIAGMMAFMMACFPDEMPEMISSLKSSSQSNNYDGFLSSYAPVLIKTYQFLATTGYLVKENGSVEESQLVDFVTDMDTEFLAIRESKDFTPFEHGEQQMELRAA